MIAKMQKLHLAAMLSDKDGILDALQKTRAAEVKKHGEEEGTAIPVKDDAALLLRAAETENALQLLTKAAEDYARDHAAKTDFLKDGFDVSYSGFMQMKEKSGEAEEIIARAKALSEEKAALAAEGYSLAREEKALLPYADIDLPFADAESTKRAGFSLGVIPAAKEEDFQAAIAAAEYVIRLAVPEVSTNPSTYTGMYSNDETVMVTLSTGGVYLIAYLKSEKNKADELLGASGFSAYPYEYGEKGFASAKARYENTVAEISGNKQAQEKNAAEFFALSEKIPFLKTYSDYLSYLLEKENVTDDIRATERVFLLEAYVPEESVSEVKTALENTTGACYYEFTEPDAEDNPPTLLNNNKAVRNFEDITNMYSVPSSREFDPNTVMGFFYSLFMGFIIGDMGYGLIMMLGGGLICWKNRARESGFKRLSAVFAMGGVFAVLWGVLFNSLLGLQVLPFTVMPDMQKDMWSLAGISVPSVLVISMEIGIAQIFTGYICRAVQCFRRGDVPGGIFDGIVWAFFSLGAFLAVIGFVEESNLPVLKSVGGITAGNRDAYGGARTEIFREVHERVRRRVRRDQLRFRRAQLCAFVRAVAFGRGDCQHCFHVCDGLHYGRQRYRGGARRDADGGGACV